MFRRMLTRLVPALLFVLCLSGIFFLAASSAAPKQPPLGARKASRLTVDGLDFKDANKNGKLDKYEDWRLPVEQRVGDLVSQMTIEEKAGLMIHSSLMGFTGPGGVVLDAPPPPRAGSPAGFTPPRREGIEPLDRPTPAELIVKRNVRWILLRPNRREPPADSARFANGLQEIAEASRLGIPIVLSSDPRHHLIPFREAFEAGTGGIMPGYAIPEGMDTVGMNFSKVIVTDLLRNKFGFQGLVVTDWLRNMPWGVENLSEKERQQRMVQAGVDQIGGDNDPRHIIQLVRDGAISESRLDQSASPGPQAHVRARAVRKSVRGCGARCGGCGE